VVFTESFDPVNMRQVIITPRILSDSHDSADKCLYVESVPPPDQLNIDNIAQCFINLDGTALILLTGKISDCLIPSEDKQTSILAYSISQGEWQELVMDDVVYPGNPEPPQVDNREYRVRKCGHEMAYDRVSGRCLLYGGRTDEHELQGNLAAELVLHRCVHPRSCVKSFSPLMICIVFVKLMFCESVTDRSEERGQYLRRTCHSAASLISPAVN
jgi:hypothetical protein